MEGQSRNAETRVTLHRIGPAWVLVAPPSSRRRSRNFARCKNVPGVESSLNAALFLTGPVSAAFHLTQRPPAVLIRLALGGRRFDKYNITADAFAELPRRIVFLREPRGRIESAWRIYSAGFRTRYCHRLGSLSEFVLAVSSDHLGDPHVAVAFEQCCHDGTFLPNRIIRWDFPALATLLGVAHMPHANAIRPAHLVT
jgi:hypothetical protein